MAGDHGFMLGASLELEFGGRVPKKHHVGRNDVRLAINPRPIGQPPSSCHVPSSRWRGHPHEMGFENGIRQAANARMGLAAACCCFEGWMEGFCFEFTFQRCVAPAAYS